ncbi:MAG: pilin [Betaproteobacteria bacterium]|nr:pilin [Betaproteobacteria bacterium]
MSEHAPQPAPAAKKRRTSWVSWLALAALVGIVIAIVLPSYGDYAHRSQAAEAVALMGSAKTPLAEYFQDQRKWPDALDRVAGTTSGKYTRSVVISRGAGGAGELELTATMKTEGVDRRVSGLTILLRSADGGQTWRCRPGTMPAKYLPQSCRD